MPQFGASPGPQHSFHVVIQAAIRLTGSRALHPSRSLRMNMLIQSTSNPHVSGTSRSAGAVVPAAGASAANHCSRRTWTPITPRIAAQVCCSSSESATNESTASAGRFRRRSQSSSTAAAEQQQRPQQQFAQQQWQQAASQQQSLDLLREPIRVAAVSPIHGVAKAVCFQLQYFGAAEVWATSAANQYNAVRALALAHHLYQQQQHKGLSAVATLSASDQAVADDQKKGLKKLTIMVHPAEPVPPTVWESSISGSSNDVKRISTNRTKSIPELMQLLLQQLSADTDAAAVVECRGEQSVTRALKAALSLQASQGVDIVIQPWAGQVVDIVAEKRGEQGVMVDGLLLRLMWAQQ